MEIATNQTPAQQPAITPPPAIHHAHIFLPIIIGGLLLLGIGTVGGYLLGNTKQQTSPSTNQTAQVTPAPDIPIPTDLPPLAVEPISKWKTYKNKDYNFTVKYPPSYTIRADKSPEDIVSFMREGNFLDIKVEKVPFANYKLDLGGAGTRAQFDATSKIWIGLYSGLPDNHKKNLTAQLKRMKYHGATEDTREHYLLSPPLLIHM